MYWLVVDDFTGWLVDVTIKGSNTKAVGVVVGRRDFEGERGWKGYYTLYTSAVPGEGVEEGVINRYRDGDNSLGVAFDNKTVITPIRKISTIFEKKSWQVQEDNFDTVKVFNNGTKYHYKGNKLYRLDGPAIEFADGSKYWYQNNKLHRLDGPAVEIVDGTKFWYINGKYYTEKDFNKKIKKLNKLSWQVQEDNFDRVEVDNRGTKVHYKGDKLHRIDGPAVEFINGSKEWYQNGKLHRLDGPAIEKADGREIWAINDRLYTEKDFNKKIKELNKLSWQVQEDNFDTVKVNEEGTKYHYKGDKLHRLDGAAIEYANGDKAWFQNAELHRLDGPAVEFINGSKEWYQNGKIHRIGGPAIEYADGTKSWWQNGKHHRLDGPAVEWTDGYKEWWVNDKQYTEEEFNKKVKELNKLSWQEVNLKDLAGWLIKWEVRDDRKGAVFYKVVDSIELDHGLGGASARTEEQALLNYRKGVHNYLSLNPAKIYITPLYKVV